MQLNIEEWKALGSGQTELGSQAIVASQPGTYAKVSYRGNKDFVMVPVIAWKIMDDGRSIPIFPHGRILGTKSNMKWLISIDDSDSPEFGRYIGYEINSIIFNSQEQEELECPKID